MKSTLGISLLVATTIMFQGCGGESSSSETATSSEQTLNTSTDVDSESFFESSTWNWATDIYDWLTSDTDEEAAKADLNDQLVDLANSTSRDEFAVQGLEITVEYVVDDYFSMASTYLLDDDWGENDNEELYMSLYNSSDTLVDYMYEFYDDVHANNAPAYLKADALEEKSLIEKIIDEIFNIISELIANLFYSPEEVIVDTDVNAVEIDPTQTFEFNSADIEGQKYYVASEQYMTITFEDDGLNGYGDIGYGLGASFESYISAGELVIDMKGIYEVTMLYKDPGYCVVTQMTDTSDGSQYPAYWFSDEETYDRATNVTTAEALCYIHSTEYEVKVIAQDGELESIQDERVGHSPVGGDSTASVVNELVVGIDRTANITDAKYFARKMRHGVFAIYTTNEQTHTLQATETEKVSRELLPLVASSAIAMQELMTSAYDSTIVFQDEINSDLNNSITEVNARLDEMISATAEAMDRTTSENNYHGISDTTSYGDIVEFEATNISLECGLAFFLCNEATADVTMQITNPQSNGREADVLFTTEITTSIIGDSEIDFSQVDAGQANNYISAADYRLNVSDFNYQRSNGLMSIKGDGTLGANEQLTFNNYEILATFTENPTLALVKFSATVDGTISTTQGRKFVGTLVFDGDNSSNSKMDGTLVGINAEPTIEGYIQTSLSSQDITEWVATHDDVTVAEAGDLNNIGEQSYTMKVEITKDDKIVSADMLVKRDDSDGSWTYMMKDLDMRDTHGSMYASSIYVVQNSENSIVDTLEKIAINGVSTDSDINTLINVGWDVASDFDNIGIEGLVVVMKPDSGDVTLHSTVHVINSDATMNADMNTTYDYATTHLSSIGDFTTVVDSSSGENSYTNSFTTKGIIKVDNIFNYLYELEYTDAEQYMLFTREDISYQMGFVIRDNEIKGGDSYGVVSTFGMNESYDILENMQLRNTDDEPLGLYNRSEDRLQIEFADGVKEYMYLY